MTSLPIVLTDAAESDILEQADWYESQAGPQLAKGWELAVVSALIRLQTNPYSGALCTFQQSENRGMRRLRIVGFPKHLIFYQVEAEKLLIIRVLHGARDLESLF